MNYYYYELLLYIIYIYIIYILYIYYIYIAFFIQLWPWPWHRLWYLHEKWPHHRGMSGPAALGLSLFAELQVLGLRWLEWCRTESSCGCWEASNAGCSSQKLVPGNPVGS
jgi:hypothetical protein